MHESNVVFFEHLFLGVSSAYSLAHGIHTNRKSDSSLTTLGTQSRALLSYFHRDLPSFVLVDGLTLLQVTDMNVAHAFFEDGLGLVYDPSVKTAQKKGVGVSWLNIGDQQVQLAVST